MSDYHPIFDDCKAKEAGRYRLNDVGVVEGFRMATDGRILVREPVDLPNEDGFPLHSKLGWDHERLPAMALPRVKRKRRVACPGNCRNGHRPAECPNCGETCSGCCGLCQTCNGDGFVMQHVPDRIQVGPVLLNADYVFILQNHGVTEVLPPKSSEARIPVYFTVPGTKIEGLLMCCEKHSE